MEDEGLRLQTLGLEAKRNCDVLLAKEYFKKSRTARSLYELGVGHRDGIQGCEENYPKAQQYFQEGWERHGCVLCLTQLNYYDNNSKRITVMASNHNYAKYVMTKDSSWLNKAALVDRFPCAMYLYAAINVTTQGGELGSPCYTLMVEAGNSGDWNAQRHLTLYALSVEEMLYWLRRVVKQNNGLAVRERLSRDHNRPCYHDLRFVELFALSWSKNVGDTKAYERIMSEWPGLILPKTHTYLFGKYGIKRLARNVPGSEHFAFVDVTRSAYSYIDEYVSVYTNTRLRVQQAVVCFVGILKRKGMSKDMRCLLGKVIWSTRETEWF